MKRVIDSHQVYCFTSTIIVNTGSKRGTVSTVLHNPVISAELLDELHSWYAEGATEDDVIERL